MKKLLFMLAIPLLLGTFSLSAEEISTASSPSIDQNTEVGSSSSSSHHHHRRCRRGPTGPTGPTGVTGATGGLEAIAFFASSGTPSDTPDAPPTIALNVGDLFTFGGENFNSGGFGFTSANRITFPVAGIYFVTIVIEGAGDQSSNVPPGSVPFAVPQLDDTNVFSTPFPAVPLNVIVNGDSGANNYNIPTVLTGIVTITDPNTQTFTLELFNATVAEVSSYIYGYSSINIVQLGLLPDVEL